MSFPDEVANGCTIARLILVRLGAGVVPLASPTLPRLSAKEGVKLPVIDTTTRARNMALATRLLSLSWLPAGPASPQAGRAIEEEVEVPPLAYILITWGSLELHTARLPIPPPWSSPGSRVHIDFAERRSLPFAHSSIHPRPGACLYHKTWLARDHSR